MAVLLGGTPWLVQQATPSPSRVEGGSGGVEPAVEACA